MTGRVPRLLPHERAFGGLFALVIARLLWRLAAGRAPASPLLLELGIWLAFVAVGAAVVELTARRPGVGAWRMRLGVYLLLMNAAYARLGVVVAALGTPARDAALQRLDRALFGAPLPLLLDGATTHRASELLSACYFLLFPYILVSNIRQLHILARDPAQAMRFFAGFYVVYALGFVGYLLVPAQGAYLAMPEAFRHAIEGGWMTRLNDAVVRRGSNRVDVFPSLHVAASAFMLFFDLRVARWRFLAYLLPAVGLWVATIYLRYHYGVGVFAGFALAALGLAIAFRMPVPPFSRSTP